LVDVAWTPRSRMVVGTSARRNPFSAALIISSEA
jgi:hypothetical protein